MIASRTWQLAAVVGGGGIATLGAAMCHGESPGVDHVHSNMPRRFDHKKHLLLAVPKKGRMATQIHDMLKVSRASIRFSTCT